MKVGDLHDPFDGSDQWGDAVADDEPRVIQSDTSIPLTTSRPVPWAIVVGRTDEPRHSEDHGDHD